MELNRLKSIIITVPYPLLYTQDTVISFNKINRFLCVYQDVTMILGSQVYSSRHFPPSYPASAGLCVGLLLILEVVLK